MKQLLHLTKFVFAAGLFVTSTASTSYAHNPDANQEPSLLCFLYNYLCGSSDDDSAGIPTYQYPMKPPTGFKWVQVGIDSAGKAIWKLVRLPKVVPMIMIDPNAIVPPLPTPGA